VSSCWPHFAHQHLVFSAHLEKPRIFGETDEIRDETAKPVRWWRPVALTAFGLAVLTLGAELVNYGANGIIRHFAFPAALMGMIITPAAIEAEEVIRQAVPSREGRHDVAVAGGRWAMRGSR
jgi:Ca2+/Na+ antiporter